MKWQNKYGISLIQTAKYYLRLPIYGSV